MERLPSIARKIEESTTFLLILFDPVQAWGASEAPPTTFLCISPSLVIKTKFSCDYKTGGIMLIIYPKLPE